MKSTNPIVNKALAVNSNFKVGDKVRRGREVGIVKGVVNEPYIEVKFPNEPVTIFVHKKELTVINAVGKAWNATGYDFDVAGVYAAAKKMVRAGAKYIRGYMWEIPEDMVHGADVIVRKAGGKVKVVGDASRDGFVIAEVTDPLAQALERKGVMNAARNAKDVKKAENVIFRCLTALDGLKFAPQAAAALGLKGEAAQIANEVIAKYRKMEKAAGGTRYSYQTSEMAKKCVKEIEESVQKYISRGKYGFTNAVSFAANAVTNAWSDVPDAATAKRDIEQTVRKATEIAKRRSGAKATYKLTPNDSYWCGYIELTFNTEEDAKKYNPYYLFNELGDNNSILPKWSWAISSFNYSKNGKVVKIFVGRLAT